MAEAYGDRRSIITSNNLGSCLPGMWEVDFEFLFELSQATTLYDFHLLLILVSLVADSLINVRLKTS
jgi:hypothetical protein